MKRDAKDPLFGAAILRLSLDLKGVLSPGGSAGYGEILDGVLADLGLTHEQVDAYIQAHRQELEQVLRERGILQPETEP